MIKLSKVRHRDCLMEMLVFLLSLIWLIPMLMVLINSFKVTKETVKLSLSLPKFGWKYENYFYVLKNGGLFRAFLNGILIAVITIIFSILISSLSAFILSRRKSKKSEILYSFFVIGIVIPSSIVPVFLLFKTLSLNNTYLGLICLFTALTIPMNIFLYTGFIKTVPHDLDDAAEIDGCGLLKTFYLVVFPLLAPMTATLIVFHFVGIWNDITNQLFFAQSDKWMLPMTVYKFYGTYSKQWNIIFADIILALLPLIIIFIIAQKYIVSGLTIGAVKT